MNLRTAFVLAALLVMAAAVNALARVVLPKIFSSHIVVQHDLPVHVWGMATPGGQICVTFRGQARSTTASADEKFFPASAVIDGSAVVAKSQEISAPLFVRHGFANNPDCNLFNGEGLPASPFTSVR